MQLKQTLEKFGLSSRKADVYLATLEIGSGTVIEIAKKAGIKRTTGYNILLELIKQGFIIETVKQKKRLFIAEDPEKIKEEFSKKEAIFNELLPQLKSIYNVKGIKPKIRYYEGKEGLREAYNDALKYNDEILAFGSEDVRHVLGEDWIDSYIYRRVKKNISLRAILPQTEYVSGVLITQDKEHLRECKMVNASKYPFSIEVDAYGYQKVALISSKEEIAVIIESKEIYNTIKLIFELLWDNLPN